MTPNQTQAYAPTKGSPGDLVRDFASRGLLVLGPDDLGIGSQIHDRIYDKEKAAFRDQRPVESLTIPEILDVLNAPGLVAVCNLLVGRNYAIVPFMHNASFPSGSIDQHWHKDDNSHSNGRKQRHHQPIQIEMLYYPQDVREDMGPTATIPYSHYWTFNHEENQDNFAGPDNLDFAYILSPMSSQPVSGPGSAYDPDDIVNRRTTHDVRMREAVTNTGWPLLRQLEAGPLKAGSVLLYSHNLFHRGNHRRDDWRTWSENPRFMWRFWLYRTTDPDSDGPVEDVDWTNLGVDPVTGVDLSEADENVTEVWRYHNHWMRTGTNPAPRPAAVALPASEREAEALRLYEQLYVKHDEGEHLRIGAAYRLASVGDVTLATRLLGKALRAERENVRRAATFGLIAIGPGATDTLIEATRSPLKWVRKAGTHALGDASELTPAVLAAVVERLELDPSVYVRSVAAGSLGCLGRRAVSSGVGLSLVPSCVRALLASLEREPNRECMARAQGRGIYFTRPTDECDMCEGAGMELGERFKPVRSAVRENALWSMVILCSHGPAVLGDALETAISTLHDVVRHEDNIASVGYASDALARLAKLGPRQGGVPPAIAELRENLLSILAESELQGWESLIRAGLDVDELSRIGRPSADVVHALFAKRS